MKKHSNEDALKFVSIFIRNYYQNIKILNFTIYTQVNFSNYHS